MPPPQHKEKDYTLFDVNGLCARVICNLQGQFLRSAAGFLVNIFTAKDAQTP